MRLSPFSFAQRQAADTSISFSTQQRAVQGNDEGLSRSYKQGFTGRQWRKLFAMPLLSAAVVAMLANPAYAAKPTTKKNSPGNGGDTSTQQDNTTYSPMAMDYERYKFRNLSGDNSCLGEDDTFEWQAIGGLKPGESFTFTPKYPGCDYHPAAISVALSWQGSDLELSSTVPDNDFASWDLSQQGRYITAPVVNNSAQLCMFPMYMANDIKYTVTVTNVGSTTASNVVVDGRSENDWAIHYYSRCINADADGDGWNDSLEHSMANQLNPLGYIDGVYQPYILWGSNYLKAKSDTADLDDEVDSSPVDFNDDGVVNHLDVEEINWYLGQGNGITLEQISPNSGILNYWANVREWRRYDLDGDGYVSETDIDIVNTMVGQPMPMSEDIIAPTARVVSPSAGDSIAKGGYYQIKGHAWDNAAITRVEYLVNGKVLCSVTDPVPTFGYTSPFYSCSWSVPKRGGQHDITIQVYDAAGNVAISDSVIVTAN